MSKAFLNIARLGALIIVLTFCVGFALFIRQGMAPFQADSLQADGAVVLTGGENRIVTAVDILSAGRVERLLISGANPEVGLDAVREAAGATSALFSCCVDVGADAADTLGNAAETADWVRQHGFDTVIVVTSDYHMPRALIEIKTALPNTTLIARPVEGPPPWTDLRSARRWTLEYLKYAAVYAREIIR